MESNLLEALNQTDTIERLIDQVHKALLTNENEAIDSIRSEYTSQMRKLIDDLTRLNSVFMSGDNPTYQDWKQVRLDIESAKVISENMSTFRQNLISYLGDEITSAYKNAYNGTLWAIDQTTPENIDPNYNLPTDSVLDLMFAEPWEGQRFSDRIWAITDQWASQIQNQLTDSILSGDSVQEMATAIRDYVGVPDDARLISRPRASAQLYRATLIARTELIRAARMAQDKVFSDNSDIIEDKEWSAKPGLQDVCDECADKDGHTPTEILDMGYDLEEHPNGRCAWIPRLKSWGEMLDPIIGQIKDMPGSIDSGAMLQPNEYGNWKPVSIEPFQEWSIKYLSDSERG